MRECPYCASDELVVVTLAEDPVVLAVRCNECGAQGPREESRDPSHAVFSLNLRFGRLSAVK